MIVAIPPENIRKPIPLLTSVGFTMSAVITAIRAPHIPVKVEVV